MSTACPILCAPAVTTASRIWDRRSRRDQPGGEFARMEGDVHGGIDGPEVPHHLHVEGVIGAGGIIVLCPDNIDAHGKRGAVHHLEPEEELRKHVLLGQGA